MLVRHQDGGLDPRLLDAVDLDGVGHVGGVVHLQLGAVVEIDVIDDAGRRGDELEIELALEPLGDDLQVQQPEEAAAEAEAQRRRALGLVGEARIVEAQARHRLAQVLELRGIDRKQAAEHDGLRRLEARQRAWAWGASRR